MSLQDALPYLSAEQQQQLASYGAQPSAVAPVDAFIAAMPGASSGEILQAASSTPSLAQAVIERLDIPNAGDITFENPYRAGINEALVFGALEVLSGIGGATFGGSSSPRQLSQVDPQVNFPRTDRIYVPGTEPPPPTRLPVPYEPPPQPGPFAFGIGGIGAILGGIIAGMWEGWPNALDPELGPYDTRAPRAAPNDPTPAEGPELGPPNPQQIPGPYADNPAPLPMPQFPGDTGSANPEDVGFGPIPDSAYGPPAPARLPAPAPAPSTTTQPHLPPWVWPVIGGIGAIQLGRSGSRSSTTLPTISVLPTPGASVDDLTELVAELRRAELGGGAAPQSYLQSGTGGVWDTSGGSDSCNCSKRSGKKRKCLARAQLSWRSGPKKGRAAGSRCYRFAD